jgi:hypothetical protein
MARSRGRMRSGFFSLVGVGVPAQLEIDAPHVVCLAVQERRLVRVERRVEPEPALRRKIRLHVDVGDEEAVAKGLALPFEPEHLPHCAARAVGGDQPVACERVLAVGGCHPHAHPIGLRQHADGPALPAHVDRGERSCALDEIFLQPVLLQIDECRPSVPRLRQEIEAIDELIAKEHLADVPADALGDDRLRAAEPVEDFERPLRVADRARSDRHRPILVQDHDGDSALAEVDRRGQADRPCADDHHGRLSPGRVELQRDGRSDRQGWCTFSSRSGRLRSPGAKRENLQKVAFASLGYVFDPDDRQPSSVSHISLSRSAVQMRGSGYCVASS